MRQLSLLLACLAVCGCSHAKPTTLEQLQALGRHAPCTTNEQCRSVALGAKSCGGPEAYMAYSTASAERAKVEALAERYRQQRQSENERSGLASDCRLLTDPGAVCRAGSCRLGGGAALE